MELLCNDGGGVTIHLPDTVDYQLKARCQVGSCLFELVVSGAPVEKHYRPLSLLLVIVQNFIQTWKPHPYGLARHDTSGEKPISNLTKK